MDNLEQALLNAVVKGLQRQINEVMETDVAPTVRNAIRRNIKEEIYGVNFGGNRQIRTNDFDRPENIRAYFDKANMSFMMRNETKPASIFNTPVRSDYPSIFGYWIEVGDVPVLWDNGNSQYVNKKFEFTDRNGKTHIIEKAFPPRPFMKKTKEQLKNGTAVQNALRKGLARKGIN